MSWIELVAQRRPPQLPKGVSVPENAKDWFQIRNAVDEEDTAEILIYDSIGGFFGMWADEFIDQLNEVTASNIKLRLNSPGGSVFEGIAIANAIRHHPANVTVYVDSLAASIASVIMLAGDRVVMMPGSQTMIHAASTACYGNAAEMRETAELLQKQTVNIAMAYQSRAGGTVDEWLARMDAETWLNAEETIALGLADEIYMPPQKEPVKPSEPAEAKMHRTWDLSMYAYAGREKAPAPTIPQQAVPGQRITAALLNGIDLSNHIAKAEEPGYSEDAQDKVDSLEPGTITVHLDFTSEDLQQALYEMIQNAVRQGLTNAISATTPAPPVTTDEPVQADDSPPAPTNTSPPPPEEEEEEEEEDSPPEEEDEPTDQADDWTSVVGLLVSPTSPGADDVFAHLREVW